MDKYLWAIYMANGQFKYNIQHSNAIKGQSRNNYTIFGRIKATHIIGAFKLARDNLLSNGQIFM